MAAVVTPLLLLTALSLCIWIYLVFFHAGFWHADVELGDQPPRRLETWPAVAVLVPARDEAEVVAGSIASLLAQTYPGDHRVILIDDHSSDGTAEIAKAEAAARGMTDRLTAIAARDLPPGWSGKLWALNEGLRELERAPNPAAYIWLTDADIAHGPEVLTQLVAKAEGDGRDLVSVMVQLHCGSFWERFLIPPFVYFFQKLYPFPAVADRKRRTAAAAGGCILVRREALLAVGGFAAMRDALIDDCTLAASVKRRQGGAAKGIWLGLTRDSRSIRPYKGLGEIWDMVARCAYTQLHHSPWLLLGTLAGMCLTYLVPPLGLLAALAQGELAAGFLALAAWALMTASALPTYRRYGLADWRALALPLVAVFYNAMTLTSALRYWRGEGGRWKGRHQASLEQDVGPG